MSSEPTGDLTFAHLCSLKTGRFAAAAVRTPAWCPLCTVRIQEHSEDMQTTDTALKISRFPVCKRRPWACYLLDNLSAMSRKRVQPRTRQAGRHAVAKQALDTDTADRMRRAGENVQEAFASGNPDTLRKNGDDMMEVNACSL